MRDAPRAGWAERAHPPANANDKETTNENGRRGAGRFVCSALPCPDTQIAEVIHFSSCDFGAAPTWRDTISPFLNTIKVGIDITLYLVAVR